MNQSTSPSQQNLFETLSEDQQMQVLNFVSLTNIEDLEQAVIYMQQSNYDVNV